MPVEETTCDEGDDANKRRGEKSASVEFRLVVATASSRISKARESRLGSGRVRRYGSLRLQVDQRQQLCKATHPNRLLLEPFDSRPVGPAESLTPPPLATCHHQRQRQRLGHRTLTRVLLTIASFAQSLNALRRDGFKTCFSQSSGLREPSESPSPKRRLFAIIAACDGRLEFTATT